MDVRRWYRVAMHFLLWRSIVRYRATEGTTEQFIVVENHRFFFWRVRRIVITGNVEKYAEFETLE